MTRYQLIKEYPGSPKKGTIVYYPHKCVGYDDKYKMKNGKYLTNFIFYDEYHIENYPEFWKKL